MAQTSLKHMWQTMKEYFGDGFAPGSAPFRNNVHYCDLERSSSNGAISSRYGVEIDEDAMPLFSVLGDTCPPPCTCYDVQNLVKHIDEFVETAPDYHDNDYSITSGKSDTSIDQVDLYIMRDVLSWWVHWGGELRPIDYWKQVYVAFAAIPDDVQIPPRDFLNGTYKYLGHTWSDCRNGLLAEGVSPETVKLAEMGLWRQMFTQYLEKIDPDLRPLLVSRTSMMTLYRVLTANTLGCAALLVSTKGIEVNALEDEALEMASIAQCLSMDMAKEAMGILQGERTETVAGDRAQLKRELRWVYVRCMEYLNSKPNAELLRRFASAGLHYVPMMDRYLERVRGHNRFAISEGMGRLLLPFIKRPEALTDMYPRPANIPAQKFDTAINAAAGS